MVHLSSERGDRASEVAACCPRAAPQQARALVDAVPVMYVQCEHGPLLDGQSCERAIKVEELTVELNGSGCCRVAHSPGLPDATDLSSMLQTVVHTDTVSHGPGWVGSRT